VQYANQQAAHVAERPLRGEIPGRSEKKIRRFVMIKEEKIVSLILHIQMDDVDQSSVAPFFFTIPFIRR